MCLFTSRGAGDRGDGKVHYQVPYLPASGDRVALMAKFSLLLFGCSKPGLEIRAESSGYPNLTSAQIAGLGGENWGCEAG
ncbi:hypothetical protein PoB_003037700 [Plakobranchus ocellatus]|uniref:Uncharacterized protein n=1 Tax=Plakobranchus ocellatus TaxID=259542 RepID=A0AAV4AA59_9GAST|nr:hypothetical protein PoB_003037700 [Plakobranchus ocellatus]